MSGAAPRREPAKAASSRYRSEIARTRETGPPQTTFMPLRAGQTTESGEPTAYHIGGRGRCNGFISTTEFFRLQNSPVVVTDSCVRQPWIVSQAFAHIVAPLGRSIPSAS